MVQGHILKKWLLVGSGLGLCAALLPLLIYEQRLPEPLASHWGLGGTPDAALPKAVFMLVLAGSISLPLVLGWPRKPSTTPRRAQLALASVVFTSALMGFVSASVIWLNWDRAHWREAGHLSGVTIALLVGVPLALSAGAFAMARRVWPQADAVQSAPMTALPLAPDERAYWAGTASNRWLMLLVVLVVMEGGLVHLMLSQTPGLSKWGIVAHSFVISLLSLMWKVRVTLNERELIIHYGQLGWPRQRIELARILSARSFELEPMEHGGWGYRGSLRLTRRAAVVVRSGLALRLELQGSKHLSITVDDAETAARLINGFVSRRQDPAANLAAPMEVAT